VPSKDGLEGNPIPVGIGLLGIQYTNHGLAWDKLGHGITKVVLEALAVEPNNHRIHRLRVLHLFEADYNLVLGVKWRQLMRHAEQHHLLNEGQYGSRSGREASALNFLEVLKNDIAHCSRKPLLNLDNDAALCYDRIIVSLASLINRKYGQHRQVVLLNAKTLQQAKYKLKTELGITERSYTNCTAFPLHGTGQGSGNSPMIWCFFKFYALRLPPRTHIWRGVRIPGPHGIIIFLDGGLC
jgi:hypothetical protein